MTDVTYNVDNLPEDVEVFTGQPKDFSPIDPSETYQVEVSKIELKDNRYYNPQETDPMKRGQKYVLSFEFIILNEGEFYGRRLWDNASLSLKPMGKQGASKLYKIVTRAMGLGIELDWESCASYAPDIKTLFRNLNETVLHHQLKVAVENTTNPETKKVKTKITAYNAVKQELPAYVPQNEQPPHPADSGRTAED